MESRGKNLKWWGVYTITCLVYVVWVSFLSFNDFDRIGSQYQQAKKRLQPTAIKMIALQELVDQCKRESMRIPVPRPPVDPDAVMSKDQCLSWPDPVLKAQQETVETRLVDEERRAVRKFVMFSVSFVVLFLILPVIILYLAFSFARWMFASVKFVRK